MCYIHHIALRTDVPRVLYCNNNGAGMDMVRCENVLYIYVQGAVMIDGIYLITICGKIWQGKILANLTNHPTFAKFLLTTNFYLYDLPKTSLSKVLPHTV